MAKKYIFLCCNKWMLSVTKQSLINVAINGFLMSQIFLMLQRGSNLMSQSMSKIYYFNV